MLGTTVSHYRILDKLGAGGMGEVYLSEDLSLRRKVALKFPREPLREDRKARRRFLREARSAAVLEHPHICAIHEICEADGLDFIVMEYVQGRTLKQKLEERPLAQSEAIRIALAVTSAIEAAHEHRIVHRDLKPSNIMVTDDGHVKVMDFGLATTVIPPGEVDSDARTISSTLTEPGFPVGTVAYMSPEQLMARPVDGRSDIFSLGIVLYEMLTGIHPFRRSTPSETALATLDVVPPPLGRYLENVPELLEHVVRKMMAKEPANRYQNSHEVLTDLRSLLDEHPIATWPEPGWLSRRSLARTALALAVSLLLLWWVRLMFQGGAVEASPKSIAVLPFSNLSPDAENDYLADGMTVDTITHLSKIRDLRVMSLASVEGYRARSGNLDEIGRQLRVATLLQGSVQRWDDQLRIGVQLVDATSLEQLWASSYDVQMREIFKIQSEVALQIVSALEAELSESEKERIAKPPTADLSAYDLYLKGRDYYARYRFGDNENAIQLFEKAIELDPAFSAAYAGLADAYVRRYYQFGMPVRWVQEGIRLSETALVGDPLCAEAHKSLGFAYGVLGWQTRALRSYNRAVELSPNYHPAIANIAVILEEQGKFDEALGWSRRSIELNPRAAISNFNVGELYWDLHDDALAEKWYRRALELEPDYAPAGAALVSVLLTQGKEAAARRLNEKMRRSSPRSVALLITAGDIEFFGSRNSSAEGFYREALANTRHGWHWTGLLRLSYILKRSGRTDEANQLLARITGQAQSRIDQGSESWHPRWFLALSHSIQESPEAALVWLQSARDSGWRPRPSDWLAPEYGNLRKEPRFNLMMEQLKEEVTQLRNHVVSDPSEALQSHLHFEPWWESFFAGGRPREWIGELDGRVAIH